MFLQHIHKMIMYDMSHAPCIYLFMQSQLSSQINSKYIKLQSHSIFMAIIAILQYYKLARSEFHDISGKLGDSAIDYASSAVSQLTFKQYCINLYQCKIKSVRYGAYRGSATLFQSFMISGSVPKSEFHKLVFRIYSPKTKGAKGWRI